MTPPPRQGGQPALRTLRRGQLGPVLADPGQSAGSAECQGPARTVLCAVTMSCGVQGPGQDRPGGCPLALKGRPSVTRRKSSPTSQLMRKARHKDKHLVCSSENLEAVQTAEICSPS